jgi:hypothetical protein
MHKKPVPAEDLIIRIKDRGVVKTLDYDGAIAAHRGNLWWGVAVGYRAMQAAAEVLSTPRGGLWRRDDLYVVGAHPGPGVRDAIDYVTAVVARDRYRLVTDSDCGARCNSAMKFEWWVSDGSATAGIKLRDDFVPRSFYDLSDRLGSPAETDEDSRLFERFKVTLSARIWAAPLRQSFAVALRDVPLGVGELPMEVLRADYWRAPPIDQSAVAAR